MKTRSHCSRCDEKTIYYREYSGEGFCGKHFTKNIEKKVYKEIKKYIHNDMKVGVGVSGGKDSLVLSHILKKIITKYHGTEMMAMYKKEGINPAGGCFPLLLQMPVFVAFFFCLRESVELRHEPFLFWIQDLSSPDPFYILPVVFAGLMYLTQQLSPQPPGMDPMQAQVMKVMPLMIAAIFVIMPSGLVVYSIANSASSLVQQRAMYKKYGSLTNGG